MTLRHIPLFIAAIVLVGCKPADKAADDSAPTPPAKTGSSSTTADSSATTPPATADATKGSIVGSWTNDNPDAPGTVVEFKDDGTASMTGTSKEMKGVEMSGTATYKIDGDKLSLKVTDVKMTPTADADDKTKKAVEQEMKMFTPDFIAKQPAETATIAWKDKDTFTSTDDKSKKVVTYTRKAG